jgi:hypothetical protein
MVTHDSLHHKKIQNIPFTKLRYVEKTLHQKDNDRLGIVVHICKLSYSGGGDQEDHSLRPALAEG